MFKTKLFDVKMMMMMMMMMIKYSLTQEI